MSIERHPFNEELIATRRGWHEHVKANPASEIDKEGRVDLDLAPPGKIMEFHSEEAVRKALDKQRQSVPDDLPDRELIVAGIDSDLMFLRAKAGDKIDYFEYLEGTLHLRPEPILESEIETLVTPVRDLLAEQGILYEQGVGSAEKVDALLRITDGVEIEQRLREAFTWANEAIGNLVELAEGEPVEIELVVKDEAYTAWLSANPQNGIHLKVNMHERNVYSISYIDLLAAHEWAHVVHLGRVSQAVRRGELNPAVATTRLHSFEGVHLEAVAETTHHILPEQQSWEARFTHAYTDLRSAVFHNINYHVNTEMSPKEALQYAERHLSLMKTEDLRTTVMANFTEPTLRTYLHTHGAGARLMQPVLLLDGASQADFFDTAYGTIWLPDTLAAEVRAAVAEAPPTHQ